MKVEVKKLDALKRVIKVEVDGDSYAKEKDAAYLEIGKELKVPGFRPGTAPLDVLQKHHSKVLKEEFIRVRLPEYYSRALDEAKLDPAGMPRIYDVEFSDFRLCFSAEVEVRPQVEIKDTQYKGIKIKKIPVEVKDDEIQKVMDNIKDEITKIAGKELAPDDVGKWAGYGDSAAFKEAVRVEIMADKYRERRRKIDSQVVRHLLDAVKCELPKIEVERVHKELLNREIHNLRVRGVPDDDIQRYKSDVEEKLKPIAEDEVKLYYVMEAIAKNENIKVEDNLRELVVGFVLGNAQYE